MGAKTVDKDSEVMMISNEGIIIQIPCSEISVLGRPTSGVKLMNLDIEKDCKVASITKVNTDNLQKEEALEDENPEQDEAMAEAEQLQEDAESLENDSEAEE
jgi:DNA gyrase subunit A